MNGDNLNNIRCEARRNKKRKYLNDRIIHTLAVNSKNTNIRGLYRGINEFKKSTNLEVTY
jgi:hypothetical protein